MAVDMFLKFEGKAVPGESTDKGHPGEIDILAWSWGVSNSATFHMGGGGGAGKASFQDLSFTQYFDKATCPLLTMAATGDHIPKGTLVVRKAGGTQLEYIIVTLEDILVTSVSTGGSGGEDRLTSNSSLNFAKVKIEYKVQDKTGKVSAGGDFQYDIAANSKD